MLSRLTILGMEKSIMAISLIQKSPRSACRSAVTLATIVLAVVAILLGLARPSEAAHFQQLYSFNGSPDGDDPQYAPVAGANGVLYGTTLFGGPNNSGTVYELIPPSTPGGSWSESIIWSFQTTNPHDGRVPSGGLIADQNGNLYGGTLLGGTSDEGAIYELSPSAGGGWKETVLWNFTGSGPRGSGPVGNLLRAPDGSLYGTIAFVSGSIYSSGSVFVLPPGGPLRMLYNFNSSPDSGAQPSAGVTVGVSGGTLYGTTPYTRITSGLVSGCGTVFQLTADAGKLAEAPIFSFPGDYPSGPDGCAPVANVVSDKKGVLYGTAIEGGAFGRGVVFSLTPPANAGGAWTESPLHEFGDNNDGTDLQGPVVIWAGRHPLWRDVWRRRQWWNGLFTRTTRCFRSFLDTHDAFLLHTRLITPRGAWRSSNGRSAASRWRSLWSYVLLQQFRDGQLWQRLRGRAIELRDLGIS